MLQMSYIHIGDSPFRYLGVPLSTKKLGYNQCKSGLLLELGPGMLDSCLMLEYCSQLKLFFLARWWRRLFVLPEKIRE